MRTLRPSSQTQAGQGLVEYAFILALVAILLFAAFSALHPQLSQVFS